MTPIIPFELNIQQWEFLIRLDSVGFQTEQRDRF